MHRERTARLTDGSSVCLTIQNPTNTTVFHSYVREVLVPALHADVVVVLDNLGAHKNQETLA